MATHTTAASPFTHSVIITVTGSSLRNGRLYFDLDEHARFFPDDCIGDRSTPPKGYVAIDAGGERLLGDIREHGARLSPRRSFARFLRQIRAEEGTHLRVTRLCEREYRIDPCS